MAIEVGQQAPEFALYNTDKIKVSLSDYRGKNVLLLFFPLAFTSVCTEELCNVRDTMEVYNDANAQVLGISVDSLFVLNKYKAEQKLNFPLLSDFNKEASASYDVLYETFPSYEMHGVSKRAAFVVDKTGIVKYVEVCSTPRNQPNFDAIRQTLATLS